MHDLADVLAGVFTQIPLSWSPSPVFAPDLVLYTPLTKAGQLLVLKGHWTQESLRLYGCSEFVVESFERSCSLVYLSLSPFQDEINKVNVKQLSLVSLYHSVSISNHSQSTNCHKPHQIGWYHWINSFGQIGRQQIARQRDTIKPRGRTAACVN